MPLQTEPLDLRAEQQSLDDELDEIADTIVELEAEHGIDRNDPDFDALDDEVGQEYATAVAEFQRTQDALNGLNYTVERYTPDDSRAVTDGGSPAGTDTATGADESEGPALDTVRKAMEAETDVDATQSESEASETAGTSVGTDAPEWANDPDVDRIGSGSDALPDQPTGAAAESETPTVVIGALNTRELASMAEAYHNDDESDDIGFAAQASQQAPMSGPGSQIYYVAAGLVNAPFIHEGAPLEAKAKAVGDQHPNFVDWLEQRLNGLSTPGGDTGNGFAERLSAAENRRSETASASESNGDTTPSTTSETTDRT